MDTDILSYFDQHMDSLVYYEAFESSVRNKNYRYADKGTENPDFIL